MHTILITQCLQTDFVGPLAPHDPLPNALHVGHREATRLLGPEPAAGPLAQLLRWARSQPTDALDILHIRDWHNPNDPGQRTHLTRFGAHCLADTPGAAVLLSTETPGSNEQTIDALTLNDFEDSNLGEVIAAIQAARGPLRIGVIGVWTEAKITFLLYELRTRCKLMELATCSALTASASRSQHFNALEQLQKILGVTVHDGVGDFIDWLIPGSEGPSLPRPDRGVRPVVEGAALSPTDLDLVGFLYRDSARLRLSGLSGGFSGAVVYRAESWDALGHAQAGSVLKLGPRQQIATERVAFERVEDVLGNDAPSVRGFADLGERAGIKYAYAAMGSGGVRTFKSLYAAGALVEGVLRRTFVGILGRFTAVAQYERLPLLSYYTFANRHAVGVRAKVEALLGTGADETLTIAGRLSVPNPARLYEADLDELDRALGEFRYVSYVHGDLNGANILLDGQENVWLIDFFHAHRGHILRDLAKLENDLLYIMTPIPDMETLQQALYLTAALRAVTDLRAPLPETVSGVTAPQLLRAWSTIRLLRSFGATVCREDRDPLQMSVALMRYAIHTQWFVESDDLQRTWALAAAGGHAEDILAAAVNRRLRVDWVPDVGAGRVGLTICPGRRDRRRDLDEDLDALAGVDRLVCLLPHAELVWAGVEALPEACAARGIRFMHLAIADQRAPTLPAARTLVDALLAAVDAGESVVVHCMGGLGRSGLVVSCMLVARGMRAEEAIAAVRAARSPRAVETVVQEQFVAAFAAMLST